jgi:hypothetical protein
MDPTANLEEQLRIANALVDGDHDHSDPHEMIADANRLAELVIALDGWITNGGFFPDSWAAVLLARINKKLGEDDASADGGNADDDTR